MEFTPGDPLGGLSGFLQSIANEVRQVRSEMAELRGVFDLEMYKEGGVKSRLHHAEGVLDTMQMTISKERRARQVNTANMLRRKTESGFLGKYYRALAVMGKKRGGRVRRERAVRSIGVRIEVDLREKFFTKWRRFHKKRLGWGVKTRGAKVLLLKNLKIHVQNRLGAWIRHVKHQKRYQTDKKTTEQILVDDLEAISKHLLTSKYFEKLLSNATRKNKTNSQNSKNSKKLLGTYYTKWTTLHTLSTHLRLRVKIAQSDHHTHTTQLKSTYYRKLHRWAVRCTKLRLAFDGVSFIRICAVKNVAKRMLKTLWRHREARRRAVLGRKVEVGLSTLANTNSILNALVEQLNNIERDKVGRKELQGLAESTPQQSRTVDALGTARDVLFASSSSPHLRHQVDDLLRKELSKPPSRDSLPSARSNTESTVRTAQSHSPSPPASGHYEVDPESHWAAHFADLQTK